MYKYIYIHWLKRAEMKMKEGYKDKYKYIEEKEKRKVAS